MIDPFLSLIITLILVLSTGVAIGADANRWLLFGLMLVSCAILSHTLITLFTAPTCAVVG